MEKQLVFIDESGDPGFDFEHGASRYFTIGVIIFYTKDDAIKMEKGIQKLRDKIKKRELKFSKATPKERNVYLTEINKYTFFSEIIVVNKEIINSHYLRTSPKSFYNFILKKVLLYIPIKNAKVILDGKGNKHFINELKSYLKRGTNQHIKDFNLKDSQKDVLLQVADVITGSIAWGYKNHNHQYKTAISKDKIDIWEFQ